MLRITVLFLIIACTWACKTDPVNDYPSLDLMAHGLPIVIKAPEGADVHVEDMGLLKDVTVKDEGDYFVQIISSEAMSLDAAAIKREKLEEVKREPFFSKIIQEDEHGFIYQKQIDEENIDYDFRLIRIQGNYEYIFQTGLLGTFTEEAVRRMYRSVQ